jgi:pimeloyl-ACP methyl ester carboxylesterase
MAKISRNHLPASPEARVRRGYFESRYGQLHVHHAMPPGGGFEEGTPLLCVHDLCGSGRAFAPFLALAGAERSVYAPDLPGFGESDGPATRPALGDYAAALADFVDTLRLRNLAVLGLRGGALLASELALSRPTQITRVILVSVPLLSEAEQRASVPAPAATDEAFRPAEWQRWAAEAAAQYPLRERLAKLTQRVLVLRPRDDLWEATGRVREILPGARLMELELPAGQRLAGAPQPLADAVRAFLST